jgi:hypothetical protein
MKKPPLEEEPIVFHRHVPYRGEAWTHYPKPPRQMRNLKGERHQYTFSSAVMFVSSCLILGIGIIKYLQEHNGKALFIYILVFITLLTIALSTMDAARSINKFRPGYDTDISDWPEEMKYHFAKEQQRDRQPGDDDVPPD